MVRHGLAFAGLPLLASVAPAQTTSLTEGDVRVQALSPTLVRIELKGPKGFEDRETFRVLRRDWAPLARILTSTGSQGHQLVTPEWTVTIPTGAKSLTGVRIVAKDGTLLYSPTGKETSRVWLPKPAATPAAWAFADSPRIVPPKWGATPAPQNDPMRDDPASGWDLTNGATDLYVFLPNRSYGQLRKDFLRLTGPSELPPLFMLGLIDSKYHPYTDTEALARVDRYRALKIPLDVLTIDTDWRLNGSHGYTPDPKYFPDMPGFIGRAKAKGVRLMFNDHPEPQAEASLDPKEIGYRWKGLTDLMNMGMDVWWYDRNWHVGLREPLPGLRGHVWGMRVYHDMTERFRPNERPVIMANTDGIDNGFRRDPPDVAAHRFSVQWTGDTGANWTFLRRAVENAVQGGVEGLNPWINDDLGGHAGSPSPELYIRFMQYGSLCPIMRPHSTRDQERAPWAFGPEAQAIVGDYVRLRYRLLPLLYASARESYDTGEPVVRRLDLDYPAFKEAARDDQYLLGRSLLVAPIVGGGSTVLPATWTKTPWRAEYFANLELQGTPVLRREEAALGFDLTTGRVAPEVPPDRFSVRWTGSVTNPGREPMRLVTTSDDGVRVWVDGKRVLDRWGAQNGVTYDVPVDLAPGRTYAVRVEYQELTGGAAMRLGLDATNRRVQRDLWVPPGTWIDLWSGRRIQGPRTVSATATRGQMPMFARTGGIVPTLPQTQRTAESPWRAVRLEAFAGADGTTTLYEDDGHSIGYRANAFRRTEIAMRSTAGRTTVSIAGAKGTFPAALASRAWTLRLHLPAGSRASGASVAGKPVKWTRLPKNPNAPMPFAPGRAADGDVIEVTVPPTSVAKRTLIEVATR